MDTRDLLIVQYPTKQHGFRYEQEICYEQAIFCSVQTLPIVTLKQML